MKYLAVNISKLILPLKMIRVQEFITMGTGNTNVPGNATLITTLTTSLADLTTANNEYEEALQICRQKLAAREAKLLKMEADVLTLASFTESATDGDAEKILSTGFAVRAAATPPQPVGKVMNVRVLFNDFAGHSVVRFKKDAHAEAYVVERSPDPITETSWVNVGTVTRTMYEGNGATPGVKYWYRVAGVNKLGQGPWSEPALRPVM